MSLRPCFAALSALAVAAVACGGSGPSTPTPVASTPLAGTFDGRPWTAAKGTATARSFNDPGERWIDIGDAPIACNDFNARAQLIGTIPWKTGEAFELGLSQNVTFVVDTDAGISNKVATNGRIEVVSAPDAGTGTVRIRARFSDKFTIEGEVQLDVCD